MQISKVIRALVIAECSYNVVIAMKELAEGQLKASKLTAWQRNTGLGIRAEQIEALYTEGKADYMDALKMLHLGICDLAEVFDEQLAASLTVELPAVFEDHAKRREEQLRAIVHRMKQGRSYTRAMLGQTLIELTVH